MNPIEHEEKGRRGAFFIEEDGERVAEMTYKRLESDLIDIDHTEVASELRENGIGRSLLDAAVQWARETGTRIKPTCPFARAQLEKNPSLQDVLAVEAKE